MAYGLTSSGFEKKDILTLKQEYWDALPDDWNKTENDPLFQPALACLQMAADLWDFAEALFQTNYVATSTGALLSKNTAEHGVYRLPATAASGFIGLYASAPPIEITPGTVVQSPASEIEFALSTYDFPYARKSSISNAYIRFMSLANATSEFKIVIVTNDTIPQTHTYTYTKTISDTLDTIADAFVDIFNSSPTTSYKYVAEYVGNGAFYLSCNDLTPVATFELFFYIDSVETTNIRCYNRFSYTAVNSGIINVPPGSITELKYPIVGIGDVFNFDLGNPGTEEETDTQLLIRYNKIFSFGFQTEQSLYSNLLQSGLLSYVQVYTNRTDSVDSDGRPAHTFECVMTFSKTDNVSLYTVAQIIANHEPYGVSSYGTEALPGTGDIYWTPVSTRYAWMNIDNLVFDTEQNVPFDYQNIIKNSFIDYYSENNIGDNFLFENAKSCITKFKWVKSVDLTIGASANLSPPTYSDDDILCDYKTLLSVSGDRIIFI